MTVPPSVSLTPLPIGSLPIRLYLRKNQRTSTPVKICWFLIKLYLERISRLFTSQHYVLNMTEIYDFIIVGGKMEDSLNGFLF